MKFLVKLFFYSKIITLFLIKKAELLDSERILGGNLTEYGSFTYQVSILADDKVICGGGIISKYFVITAAHCIYEDNKFIENSVAVLAGVNYLFSVSTYRVIVPVHTMYVPAKYDYGQKLADIAILRLKKPLNLDENPYISKLNLPDDQSDAYKEAIVTGFGWDSIKIIYNILGVLQFRKGLRSHQMRFARTRIIDHATCQKMYKFPFLYFFTSSNVIVKDTHICAQVESDKGNAVGGICDGDSGSPLVYNKDTIIGIVIGGLQTCNEKYAPGLYTRISSYMDFIDKAMMNIIDKTILSSESCF